MFAELFGVIRDAAVSLDPQPLLWPRGIGGTVLVYLKRASDGLAFDPSGSTVTFTVRPAGTVGANAGAPLISRTGSLVSSPDGTVAFALVPNDTLTWAEAKSYRYDVQLRDTLGVLWQVVDAGEFRLDQIVGYADDSHDFVPVPDGAGPPDHNVSVTDADTTPAKLQAKIAPGAGLVATVINPGANEQLKLDVVGSGAAAWTSVRYFFVDNDAGIDTQPGFLDAVAGATFSPSQLVGIPLKTTERLYEIVPQLGNGRQIVILQKARMTDGVVNFANYVDKDTVTQSSLETGRWLGYRAFLWRGSTDLSNDANDKITCGFGIAVAGPNVDGSFTVDVGPTTTTIPLVGAALSADQATQFRVRVVNGTRATQCRVITSHTGSVLSLGNATTGGAVVAGDKVVIERPGVRMNQVRIDTTGLGIGVYASSPSLPYFAGISFASVAAFSNVITGPMCGVSGIEHAAATTNLALFAANVGRLYCDVFYGDETGNLVTIGMGMRVQCGSTWTATNQLQVNAFGAMNLAALTSLTAPSAGAFGSRSFLGGSLSVRGPSGGGGVRQSPGVTSGEFILGDPSASNAQPRLVSGGAITPFTIFGFPCSVWRFRWEGCTAATHGQLYVKDCVGGAMNIDGCTSDGAGPYGVDISGCHGTTFLFGNTLANTLTGTLGDIRPGPFNGPVVMAHTDLTKTGFRDPEGNLLQGTADLTSGETVVVANKQGGGVGLAPGNTVYLSASGQVKKTDASVVGSARLDGIMVTTTPDQGSGLMIAPVGVPYVLCQNAVAALAQLNLSAVTPGTVTDATPGTVVPAGRAFDADGVKTAVRAIMNNR